MSLLVLFGCTSTNTSTTTFKNKTSIKIKLKLILKPYATHSIPPSCRVPASRTTSTLHLHQHVLLEFEIELLLELVTKLLAV
ncbi:unnamed protein product [Amoebophrya sp. A25]|nr:unnamed protein product [Amoebophrya sp. A25]|eukprot:GSA25T00009276001.1